MLVKIVFLILGLLSAGIIAYAMYQLVTGDRLSAARGHVPVSPSRYRITQLIAGILLGVSAFFGYRRAREREERLGRRASGRE